MAMTTWQRFLLICLLTDVPIQPLQDVPEAERERIIARFVELALTDPDVRQVLNASD